MGAFEASELVEACSSRVLGSGGLKVTTSSWVTDSASEAGVLGWDIIFLERSTVSEILDLGNVEAPWFSRLPLRS